MFKRFITILVLCLFLVPLVACEKEGPAEKAGEKIDKAVEKTAEKIKEVGETEGLAEKTGKKIDKAVDQTADEIEKAGEVIKEQAEETSENIKQSTQ